MDQHVVRSGETLSAIAHRYGTTARILARMNDIPDPNRVDIGRRLVVPGSRDTHPTMQHPRPRSIAPQSGVRTRTDTVAPRSAAPAGTGESVTAEQIRTIMPRAGNRADTYVGPLNAAMRAHGIDTTERRAAFLAQISVESGDLRHTEESLNYSVQGLGATFGDSRISDADQRRLGRRPGEPALPADRQEAIANIVYGGQFGQRNLGNRDAGDGYRYRGRGLMQTTGRANYRAAGYEDRPEALAEPDTAADSAASFWADNGLNARTERVLDRQQFNRVSRTVNGGGIGINERWQAYQRALNALQSEDAP